ncbi:MAG TPA: geranylgeranyl reductase family protein [Planctomycetota bacterium]
MRGETELLVIGAGPAGSSAAAAALGAGLAVTQLEAARFPRVKPCAGGLTPKAVAVLPVALAPSLRGSFVEFEFNAWRGSRTVYSFRAPVLSMVARPELDARLVAENRARPGFAFHDGERVLSIAWRAGRFHVRTAARELVARQLVGADGANGIVNRTFRVSAPRARALAVEVVLPRAELAGDPVPRPCFDFGALPRGYGWVFPKDDQVSVGLYTLAGGLKDVRARLAQYLAAKGLRVRGDALASFEAHTIPLGGERLRDPGLPLYVAGDAAGLADALTGEGIYHALASGRIAGELAARVAHGQGAPEEYRRRLARPVLADTRWSLRLAPAFYARPDLALRLLRSSPLWRALVHGTGSGATFSACLRGAPRLWWTSRRAGTAALQRGPRTVGLQPGSDG